MSSAYGTETVLVVGAEKMSSIIDWSDRSTCVLFVDGTGVGVLKRGKPSHRVVAWVLLIAVAFPVVSSLLWVLGNLVGWLWAQAS